MCCSAFRCSIVWLRSFPTIWALKLDLLGLNVSHLALVRYRMPIAYGFRDVLVKGFVD